MLRPMKAGLATSLSIAGVLATGGAALVLNSSILDTESSAKGSPAFATVVGLQSDSGVMPLGGDATTGSAAELSANGVADVISGDQSPMVAPVEVSGGTQSAPASTSTAQSAGTTTPSAKTPAANGGQTGAIKQTQAAVAATETTVLDSPSTTAAPVAPTSTSPTTPPTTTVGSPTTSVPATEKQFKVGDAATITLVVNGTKLLVKDIVITPGSGYKVTNQVSRDGDDVRITLTSPTRAVEFSARLVNGQIMAAVSTPSSGNLNPPRPPHHDDDDDDDEHHEREHDDDDDHEREHDDDD